MPIKIYLKSNKYYLLKTFVTFITSQIKLSGCKVFFFFLPTKTFRMSLLKSPHVYKKHKDHYQQKTFSCVVYMPHASNRLVYHFVNQKPIEIACKIVYSK